jgi:hypothetical protein
MPPPLRRPSLSEDDENSPESPEAMLISAYLEDGRFTPHKHRIEDDDIVAWRPLWDLCLDYQNKTGVAPPMSLVKMKFPDFRILPDLRPEWAAEQVARASTGRMMRTGVHSVLGSLNDDNLEEAYAALEKVRRPRGYMKEPVNVFDHTVVTDRFNMTRIEVPYSPLMTASGGGIGMSEYWVLAARLNQGKSWEACGYGARAATIGFKVAMASFEMPGTQVAYRTLRRMAGRDPALSALLLSDEERDRKEAADIIHGRVDGSFSVFDPSHGRINTTASVRDMCEEYDFVVLDHIGLMQDAQGRRAMDDWRVMATISNVIREITLETQTPVFALAQISREGEKGGPWSPPKTAHISQSDAIGQDADVVITFKRPHPKGQVMVHSAEKMRDGQGPTWFTRFNPGRGIFTEISNVEAHELHLHDIDRLGEPS